MTTLPTPVRPDRIITPDQAAELASWLDEGSTCASPECAALATHVLIHTPCKGAGVPGCFPHVTEVLDSLRRQWWRCRLCDGRLVKPDEWAVVPL